MSGLAKTLIITGYGVNCEAESKEAWERAGAETHLVHLNDLLADPSQLQSCGALMFIGGFSFGDHMTSGHAFAQKIKNHMQEPLQQFIDDRKLIMGICNGFQVMTKIGLLPGLDKNYFSPKVALMQNDCGTFQNYWVDLQFESAADCVFTRGITRMQLPIRHGEGKLFTADKKVLSEIESRNLAACRYVDPETGEPAKKHPHNPNGSLNAIAGLRDETGRVFGMMPHPEAYLFPENHPDWMRQRAAGTLPEHGEGLKLFLNAVDYLKTL